MSKQWKPSNPGKQTVELRPSRIRRDPPPSAARPGVANRLARWDPTERETWVVVIGVFLFAVAFAIITFAISDYTSQ